MPYRLLLPFSDIEGAPLEIKNERDEGPAYAKGHMSSTNSDNMTPHSRHGNPTRCDDIALIADYDVLDLSVQPFYSSTELTPLSASQKIYLHSTSLAALCEKEAVRYHTDYR